MKLEPCVGCPTVDTCIVRGLPDDVVADFHASAKFLLCKPHQLVFHEASFANGLFMLCRGTVRLYQSSSSGPTHVLGVVGDGEVLAELLMEPSRHYSVSAEAVTESQVCYLPSDVLVGLVHRHPAIGLRLITALSRSLSEARNKARVLALKRPIGRLAALLLDLLESSGHRASGERTRLPYSRRALAEMIGVSPETAVRLLSRLKREGIVDADLHSFVVVDAPALAQLAEGVQARHLTM